MNKKIKLDLTQSQVSEEMMMKYQEKVDEIHEKLHSGKEEYTGWVEYGMDLSEELISDIEKTAKKVRENTTAFVILGIGGSYLGTRSCLDMLSNTFHNQLPGENPKIYYAGHNMSSAYYLDLLRVLEGEEVSVCVISKSGTTIETSVAFSIFKEFLKEKYKGDYAKRIIAVTDKEKGILRPEAIQEGYKTFEVPDTVGGRYSVITPVGLLPIAVAGIDIRELIKGNKDAYKAYENASLQSNDAYRYGVARYLLNKELGKDVECYEFYETKLKNFTEWMKQLFGESEGKEGQGLFPVTVEMTTELHSMGQYLQDGKQIFAETVLNIEDTGAELPIPSDLGYDSSWTMEKLNKIVMEGVIQAHTEDNGTPTIQIGIADLTAHTFGFMVYFFEKACGMCCYLREVNPFDQPGVEKYKASVRSIIQKG
ncbi:MAG: glucose-6-phosphate isomerase [Proteocatella sp.]